MDVATLARNQPHDIGDALKAMRETLEIFHERNDKRAIFLRLYYIMTREVEAAIRGLGAYEGKAVFLDRDWIARLSGRFCSLYFESLDLSGRDPGEAQAWTIANKAAESGESTVVQNALLGINAHINYDLAHAIADNMIEYGDLGNRSALMARRFDHDQVNNLLVRSLPYIQAVLARDYGPGIATIDRLLGSLDERVSALELKYYRERVWGDALAFAAALDAGRGGESVVVAKLNWESHKLAQLLAGPSLWQQALWYPERLFTAGWRLLGGSTSYTGIRLEEAGSVPVTAVGNPFR
ncbi:DUF5995 family protein [Pseudonocardia sp.]|uniref:DUF5995 family protein n=1 Tax=Pseudonocardia sp. TaxID=60912 RepID=UPI003D120A3A